MLPPLKLPGYGMLDFVKIRESLRNSFLLPLIVSASHFPIS